MDPDHRTYSRYQILCAEREAWLDGESDKSDSFFYDGVSFWRRDAKGKQHLVPSWRAPGHGWRHAPGCTCALCATEHPVAPRPLSTA